MIVIEPSQVEGFTRASYGRGEYKKKEEDHVRVATTLHIQNISIQAISGHMAIHLLVGQSLSCLTPKGYVNAHIILVVLENIL